MSDEPPNIVMVTVDSLRADHCSFMGYEKETTPALDRMAEDGLVFENAIAPGPSTPESMPAIFTGHYPAYRELESGTESGLAARRERIRAHMRARETLPKKLQRRGYTTAAFTSNPFTSHHFGFDAGFDYFQDFMGESNRGELYQRVFQGFLEESGVSSMARVFLNFWNREEVFKPWEAYYDELQEWLETAEEPYFLWVFLMDAHNPYIAPAKYRSQAWWKQFHANFEFWRQSHETPFSDTIHERLVTAYDDAIRYSDAFLERLQNDVGEETVIAVHGDHGEAFGEHGTYGHEPYLHDENVRVPLVIRNGGDATVSNPISLRRLPDLLLGFGDKTSRRYSRSTVYTRTRQGGKHAVVSPEEHYIAEKSQNGESSLADRVQLRLLQQTAHEDEQVRIGEATSAVTNEGCL